MMFCPDCKVALKFTEAKAPEGKHTAKYWFCETCKYFVVQRTPEHEAELEKKK